jgi:hypothetical protein
VIVDPFDCDIELTDNTVIESLPTSLFYRLKAREQKRVDKNLNPFLPEEQQKGNLKPAAGSKRKRDVSHEEE